MKFFLFVFLLSQALFAEDSDYIKTQKSDSIYNPNNSAPLINTTNETKITGTVLTDDAMPLPVGRANIEISLSSEPKKIILEKTTDASGRFDFNLSLTPGEYLIKASKKKQSGFTVFKVSEDKKGYFVLITVK